MMVWYPLISSGITTVLSLAKDVLFCLWSRKKLYSEFHTRAARALAPIPMPLPPPLPGEGTPTATASR